MLCLECVCVCVCVQHAISQSVVYCRLGWWSWSTGTGLQPHCLLSFTNQVDSGHSFTIKDKPSVPFTTFLFSPSRLCSVQNDFIWALLKIVKFLHLLPTLISSSLPWSISVRPLPKPCRGGGINNHQLLYRTRIPHSVCFFVFFQFILVYTQYEHTLLAMLNTALVL